VEPRPDVCDRRPPAAVQDPMHGEHVPRSCDRDVALGERVAGGSVPPHPPGADRSLDPLDHSRRVVGPDRQPRGTWRCRRRPRHGTPPPGRHRARRRRRGARRADRSSSRVSHGDHRRRAGRLGPVEFAEVASASSVVAATTKRSEKIAVLAELLGRAPHDEIEAVVAFSTGTTLHGRLGVGWAALRDVRPAPATVPSLTVGAVDRSLAALTTIAGAGSQARRRDELHELLAAATEPEQRLLVAIIGGELRQGALDGVVAAAVAKAAGLTVADVQRGAMFAGSLPVAARVALVGGRGAGGDRADTGHPGAADARRARGRRRRRDRATGPASVEWKLDGARIQAHRAGGEVRLFTRNLNDVTDRWAASSRSSGRCRAATSCSTARCWASTPTGAPRRFQDTMGDFGAETAVERGGGLRAFFFDVLHAGVARRRAAVRPDASSPARDDRPGDEPAAVDRHRRPDRGAAVPRRVDRRRARGGDGEGPRRALRGGSPGRDVAQGEAGATRSTSSCSPWSGGTAAARAGCRTCTSERATATVGS
jgi:hypothetical protein